MRLQVVQVEDGLWGANLLDYSGNRWEIDCGEYKDPDRAYSKAMQSLQREGKRAFAVYTVTVGGKTYDGKDIPSWDSLTELVQEGWMMAAFAVEKGLDAVYFLPKGM